MCWWDVKCSYCCCCFRFHCRMCGAASRTLWHSHTLTHVGMSTLHTTFVGYLRSGSQPKIHCNMFRKIASILWLPIECSSLSATNEMQISTVPLTANKEQRNEFSEQYLAICGYIYTRTIRLEPNWKKKHVFPRISAFSGSKRRLRDIPKTAWHYSFDFETCERDPFNIKRPKSRIITFDTRSFRLQITVSESISRTKAALAC